MQTRLTLKKPDDWHVHVRDGDALAAVSSYTAQVFGRAMIMPNLKPPIVNAQAARAYQTRILASLPSDLAQTFQPKMAIYLTDQTRPEDLVGLDGQKVFAVKYYPAGATTNAENGVTNLAKKYDIFAFMAENHIPLLLHGEVTHVDSDVFDREALFIREVLIPLRAKFPKLKMTLEHITTQEAVDFVRDAGENTAATITPQHIAYNRNALFQGGIRPHYYCLPILKAEKHRRAVAEATFSGHPRFFLGTDSAPHAQHTKENACGCAGMFSAPIALPFYVQCFEQAGALDKFENFASVFGAQFYGVPVADETITLVKQKWQVPSQIAFGEHTIVPMCAGENLDWQIQS